MLRRQKFKRHENLRNNAHKKNNKNRPTQITLKSCKKKKNSEQNNKQISQCPDHPFVLFVPELRLNITIRRTKKKKKNTEKKQNPPYAKVVLSSNRSTDKPFFRYDKRAKTKKMRISHEKKEKKNALPVLLWSSPCFTDKALLFSDDKRKETKGTKPHEIKLAASPTRLLLFCHWSTHKSQLPKETCTPQNISRKQNQNHPARICNCLLYSLCSSDQSVISDDRGHDKTQRKNALSKRKYSLVSG